MDTDIINSIFKTQELDKKAAETRASKAVGVLRKLVESYDNEGRYWSEEQQAALAEAREFLKNNKS